MSRNDAAKDAIMNAVDTQECLAELHANLKEALQSGSNDEHVNDTAATKDSPYDLVEIQLFKDNRRYKDDLKVFVNGRNWVIQRGVPVKVPRYVANVIHRGQKQDMASDAMVMNLVERYEARTKEEAT